MHSIGQTKTILMLSNEAIADGISLPTTEQCMTLLSDLDPSNNDLDL